MSLTEAEKRELAALERDLADEEDENRGQEAVQRRQVARAPVQTRKPAATTRPFSIYRATVGALRDAAQGALDSAMDLGSAIWSSKAPQVLPGAVGNAIQVLKKAAPAATGSISKLYAEPVIRDRLTLPKLEGEDNAGTAERVVRGIGSFAVPFVGASRAVGVARATGVLGRVGRGMVAGATVDFTQVDPVEGNMAKVIKDAFGIKSDVLDSLVADDDDENFEKRAKAALAGAPLGVVGDLVMEAGMKTLRAYRAWKGSAIEADATIKNIKQDMGLDPKARNLPVPANDTGAAGARQPGTVDGGSLNRDLVDPNAPPKGAGAEDAEFRDARAYNPETDVNAAPPPETFEDVLEVIKRKIGEHSLDEDAVARFAENLLFGNPENALAKIGIDPAKLDFSAYDDPDLLGRLQKGMAELYETYASRLGRSNQRITEEATTAAARAMASTPDTLKSLLGSTTNLAEELTASRLFVGAHAHKMLYLADEAAAELTSGAGAGEKWAAFMEAFHRHAYYLGTLRGAGSEVGRALRSLQIIAKSGKPSAKATAKATENVAQAAGKQAAAQTRQGGAAGFIQGASDFADRLVTDAEKLEALTRLRLLGGDVGELSREVRRGNMSILRRLDDALRETMGNLFGPATASYNILAGGAMLGARTMTRFMGAMTRLALAPLAGKEMGVSARVAFMDTWAYGHGIVSGFSEAYQNAILMLQREGGAELALNLDSIGLRDAARDVAASRAEAARRLGERTYERADTETYRNFAVLPHEQQELTRLARELPGPKFFSESLAALARIGAGAINAAGSASRLGTILFINMPDQFIGTLAARAGAYSHSVRTAASEAAEMGLEGAELTTYLKARTVQLTEHPIGWNEDGFSAGVRESAAAVGEVEAREVLFQDDLELTSTLARGLGRVPLLHIFVPFVKTPLRILERTAIDYTPLGLLKDRVRQAILAGGPARDEAIARIGLGMTALVTAATLAEDRTIVGSDGGYISSSRLSRPSYSIKIGDDAYEFSRIDPFGTLLGFGADLNRFYQDLEGDPDRDSAMANAIEGFLWATSANILSKTWLTGLRNLTELSGATSDEDSATRIKKIAESAAVRLVPASGVQRQIEAAGDGIMRQAIGFNEALIKSTVGSGTLPVRRDNLLGRPVPMDGLVRLVGVRGGPGADPADDPLGAEVERLSFQIPASKRKLEGVSLNSAQFSRYMELKGQVVKNPETGLTLEQTLEALIKLPEYQAMNDRQRVTAMRDEMKGFSRLATDQLMREDKAFALAALRQEVYDDVLNKQGGTATQADAQTQALAKALGLGQ